MIKAIEIDREDKASEIRAEHEENKKIQILKHKNGFVIKLKSKELTHIIYFTKNDFLKLCKEIQKFI